MFNALNASNKHAVARHGLAAESLNVHRSNLVGMQCGDRLLRNANFFMNLSAFCLAKTQGAYIINPKSHPKKQMQITSC